MNDVFNASIDQVLGTFFDRMLLVLFIISPAWTNAQVFEQLDRVLPQSELDSSYVDNNFVKWSLRAGSTIKTQRISLRNSNSGSRINYIPNNRAAITLGVSYKSIFVDIGLNLKINQRNPTRRFDLQGAFLLKSNFFSFHVQRYKGFEMKERNFARSSFRNDIKTFSTGLSYLFLLNRKKMSMSSIFTGTLRQKRSTGTFGLGPYFIYNKIEADSSIVPRDRLLDFNPQALIQYANSKIFGVLAGYGHIWVLQKDFFIFVSATPGLGYANQELSAELGYRPSAHHSYLFRTWVSLGVNKDRYYLILSLANNLYSTSIGFENRASMNIGKIKLVYGWKNKER